MLFVGFHLGMHLIHPLLAHPLSSAYNCSQNKFKAISLVRLLLLGEFPRDREETRERRVGRVERMSGVFSFSFL